MENKITNIYMVGVGGQGIIRASDILCEVAMRAGFDVKKSEVHGMAQRGGSVTSHVRYGKKVYSPLSAKGDVDILVAFERLEVLRYLDYIRPGGRVILSDQELYPPIVNLGEADYPEQVADTARRWTPHVQEVNAVQIARDAGNIKAENTAMLGALSVWLDFAEEIWDAVFREAFPAKVLEANLKAFSQGRKAS
ncbi:MAG: indolepyruvate oxidoreductase subunit beta [Syntrophobacterales bacterium]|jgi:indolepyruvate ferredoxin oxidoreductase beta subunit|nr:indolepyruvate oxidoreductase subunit beta [Syntrophobacterales bacterium]